MGTLTINNAACNIVQYPVGYGLLYNFYAATDGRKITISNDWVVPSMAQFRTLSDYLGNTDPTYVINTVGTLLKEQGDTYWNNDNTGTNSTGFNGRGAGVRTTIGFDSIKDENRFWNTVKTLTSISSNNESFNVTNASSSSEKVGMTIRLLYVGAGTPTSYVGNDGKTYRIVTIGTQIWLADGLSETRFRNGDIIPWFGANPANYFTNAEWAALTSAGCCAYENDVNNVAPGFSFPT